ncbi:arginine--tRNA ligase [Sutcliffiella rhizosphaerae]|uniref:Arginine--tRNA ligase n=1 Tax=Sutcliffiella rhizosphaerae TaxID=2880967 RepID=A0ABM8YKX1_9BACI|nr:arginine--tRNA ligase [Sutcliffiella rhizosphaerae]CAG9620604.1 Arginine--tRNA ligase [Sutcliffiella rhizosphaerae]
MKLTEIAVESLQQVIQELSQSEINLLMEKPKYAQHGDLSFPCFSLAKIKKQPPPKIAIEIASQLKDEFIEKAEAVGPYVNIFFKKDKVQQHVVKNIMDQTNNYGNLNIGKQETVVLDLSSPNIAKPFSMGHLRSTVIGNSIANILEKCGYNTVRINYLGDWGTQFGKLIAAYIKWGDDETIQRSPIPELLKLYVRFHEEAAIDPSLEDEGRLWFKKLEDGEERAVALWKWFREESLNEFNKIYQLLGVTFDSNQGEAFYNDKMEKVVSLLAEKGLLEESNGAKVIQMDDSTSLPPCLIKKSDGATLYATRDLAAALYRKEMYHFSKALYIVGQEQTIHFQQIKAVLKKAGFEWSEEMYHISFGLLLKDGKKMSTRKGKIVLLEQVIEEAIQLAKQNIENKNPNLQNKLEVARQVGVGSIIFHDLKNYRLHSVEFSLEDMLKFEGETGPYVQYTYARAKSILRKGEWSVQEMKEGLNDSYSWELTKLLNVYPQIIQKAINNFDPSTIAKHIIDVCQSFNSWYAQEKFLVVDEKRNARLSLVYSTSIVIKESLYLLGMDAPEEM